MRQGGILLPIFSLPGPYGIGTFGANAKAFIDFLVRAGQTYWQILPLSPTDADHSPYRSPSAFAGNPDLIDLDRLYRQGLLEKSELADAHMGGDPTRVHYEALKQKRYPLLKKAAQRFLLDPDEGFAVFCTQQTWLEDYALFMAIKEERDDQPWQDWEWGLKFRENGRLEREKARLKAQTELHKAVQYFFFTQWRAVHEYAKQKGIRIIGDLPIYVSYDSADVWADPAQFRLDDRLKPTHVAGCPPDAFTETGQLWGNPLFDWGYMKKVGYRWWIQRLRHAMALFDVIRLDHFRGFEAYYAIPAEAKTAENGRWESGPGMALFDAVTAALGKVPIIAEDLGYMSEGVRKLLRDTGFPGMKVLQFAFDKREDSDHLPHNYPKHCVAYTGTHDNDTALGWMQTASAEDVEQAKKYLHLTVDEGYAKGMMRGVWASPADTAIVQMQDVLGLSGDARTNTPGTPTGNWRWRMASMPDIRLADELREQMEIFKRMRKDETI